jgi:hypothetical protein
LLMTSNNKIKKRYRKKHLNAEKHIMFFFKKVRFINYNVNTVSRSRYFNEMTTTVLSIRT